MYCDSGIFLTGVALLLGVSQGADFSLPQMPPIKNVAPNIRMFVNLWEFALRTDGTREGVHRLDGVNSLLIPSDYSTLNLLHQDAPHPLYSREHSELRNEFLLSHISRDSINNRDLPSGVDIYNLMGNKIQLNQDRFNRIWANGVEIESMISLHNGVTIYILNKPLFGMSTKIRQAVNGNNEPNEPTGPPLVIPGSFSTRRTASNEPQPPAPPPPQNPVPFNPPARPQPAAQPPAPPPSVK